VRPLAFLRLHLTSSDPVGRATGASAHGPVYILRVSEGENLGRRRA